MIGQFIAARLSPKTERVVYPYPLPDNLLSDTKRLVLGDESASTFTGELVKERITAETIEEKTVGVFIPGRLFYDYRGRLFRVI